MSEVALHSSPRECRPALRRSPGGRRVACRTGSWRREPQAEHLADYLDVHDRLLRIARRIAGNQADAADIVQDAWLRWHRTDRGEVRDAPAFLSRLTARLAINAIQTAHVRHRTSVGLWPMEQPGRDDDPAVIVERADEFRAAMLLLVQRLTPRERSAYVLRQAFGYPHRQIGEALGLTESNTRQLLRRAQARLTVEGGRPASRADQARLMDAFLDVARSGDPGALAEHARTSTPVARTRRCGDG
jgi:RNA polymerase sigma factor (sigma-70 family)